MTPRNPKQSPVSGIAQIVRYFSPPFVEKVELRPSLIRYIVCSPRFAQCCLSKKGSGPLRYLEDYAITFHSHLEPAPPFTRCQPHIPKPLNNSVLPRNFFPPQRNPLFSQCGQLTSFTNRRHNACALHAEKNRSATRDT